MTKNILILLAAAAAFSFTACSTDEEQPHGTPGAEKIAWQVHFRGHGVGEQINADAADAEDKVDNVILAGSTYSATLTGGATAAFSVESFLGKKDFFFAANLNATDAERLGISGLETDFNKLEFKTQDYLRGAFGNDAKAPIPMSAALRDVTSPTNTASGVTSLSQSDAKLERLFSRVEVKLSAAAPGASGNLTYPYDIQVTGVRVINVPAKFSLGGAIAGYDLKHAAAPTDYPYLDFALAAPTVDNVSASTGRRTYKDFNFYVPENFVAHPVFRSADLNGMTALEITFTETWITDADAKAKAQAAGFPEPQSGKCYYRIGIGDLASPRFGQLARNHAYKCVIHLGEQFKKGPSASGDPNNERIRLAGRVLN